LNRWTEEVLVTFDEPQRALTPGRRVFYDGDIVVGGGWIENSAQMNTLWEEPGVPPVTPCLEITARYL